MGSYGWVPPTSEFVRPSTPLTPETVSLAPSDQFIIRNFVTTILCFKIDNETSVEETVSNLKHGLANTIEEMPFLAGTLVLESEERCTQAVEIREDAGVEFTINDMSDLSGNILYDFDGLAAAFFPPSALDFDQLVTGTLIPPPEPVCLTVQANLIRGGILLCIHSHHGIMDGSGLFSFFRCLSKHTAASSRSQVLRPWERISEESIDRTLLSAGPARREMSEYPGFRPAREDSWAAKADAGKLMARLVAQSEQIFTKKVMKTWWILGPEQLLKLEEDIASSNPDKIKPTLNSTISALCWRHISLARRLGDETEHSSLLTVCDFRARLDPPLPPEYVGNALMFAKAKAPLTELCTLGLEALYKTASRITESVNWWDSEKIQGLLSAVEGTADMRSVEWDCDSHFGPDVQITSTLGAASPYNLDWGEQLGKMQALRFPTGAFYDGFVTVLPRLPDGGVELVINVGAEVLKHLRADEEFTRYALFLCY